jgi:hypothetical protein
MNSICKTTILLLKCIYKNQEIERPWTCMLGASISPLFLRCCDSMVNLLWLCGINLCSWIKTNELWHDEQCCSLAHFLPGYFIMFIYIHFLLYAKNICVVLKQGHRMEAGFPKTGWSGFGIICPSGATRLALSTAN